jgi:GTPase SAR1 family protein
MDAKADEPGDGRLSSQNEPASVDKLFFDYKSRILVVAPSGSGKTTLLLSLVQTPNLFPPDIKGVYWVNLSGIEHKAKGFEIFEQKPSFFHLLRGDEALSLMSSPTPEFSKCVVILDDCFSSHVDKNTKETLEKQMKRNVNHDDLIMFITTQATFSESFSSELREQANVSMFINNVGETQKFEQYATRIMKNGTLKEGRIKARILRQIIDKHGFVDHPLFAVILFKESGYDFKFWGWTPDKPEGYLYRDISKDTYKVVPYE